MSSQLDAQRFADDPMGYFDHSSVQMDSLAPRELDDLQLKAAQYRFESLRNAIPMLTTLADKQGIGRVDQVEDLIPLLFEHTMYKSYPSFLLEKSKFSQLTEWLNKLTSVDMSSVDVSECHTIDEWIACIDRNTDIRIVHSSGTTGTMSFLPLHSAELDVRSLQTTAFIKDRCPGISAEGSREDPLNMHVVFPYFRRGGKIYLRANDGIAEFVAGDESRFHAAYPGGVSSDIEYLSARIRHAQASGKLDRIKINPKLLERKKDFDALQKDMPEHLERFFAEIVDKLQGENVFITGTWNLVYNMAEAGLKQGLASVFSKNSFVLSGGGAKGMTPPEDWKEKVAEFVGVDQIQMAYGMSEINGTHHMCSAGHYHVAPWHIPYVLDPDTSAPLPRSGTVTGRACFFDLVPTTHWGGFITGDEITLNWDGDCTCGRKSAFILDNIERYSEKRGGDDKISCAATPEAHQDAMRFLNNF